MIWLGPYRLPDANFCRVMRTSLGGGRAPFYTTDARSNVSVLAKPDQRFVDVAMQIEVAWQDGFFLTESEAAVLSGLHETFTPVRFRWPEMFERQGILHPADGAARVWCAPYPHVLPPGQDPLQEFDWDGWIHLEDSPTTLPIVDEAAGTFTFPDSAPVTVDSKVNAGYDFGPPVLIETCDVTQPSLDDARMLLRSGWLVKIALRVVDDNVAWQEEVIL